MLSLTHVASALVSRLALAGSLTLAHGAAGQGGHATTSGAKADKSTQNSKDGKTGKTGHDAKNEKASSSDSKLPPALAAVVDKVQARYDGARDFTAGFEQALTNAVTKRATTSAGKVSFKKVGKMRWDYTSPEPRMVLADGTQLWLWEPEDRQAFRQGLASSQLPAALAFLTGHGKLTDEFVIGEAKAGAYGKPGEPVLELTPKKPSAQVQRVFFVVEPSTSFVRETVVVDAQGNTNHLSFRDIQVNTDLPDGLFAWTPPAGTRVIDPSGSPTGSPTGSPNKTP
jgi:outer membrane lipoprotein carrier protein